MKKEENNKCETCSSKEDCLYFRMKGPFKEDDPKKLAKKIGKAMREGAEEQFQKMKKDPEWRKLVGLDGD